MKEITGNGNLFYFEGKLFLNPLFVQLERNQQKSSISKYYSNLENRNLKN
jgi:hypothetical protein